MLPGAPQGYLGRLFWRAFAPHEVCSIPGAHFTHHYSLTSQPHSPLTSTPPHLSPTPCHQLSSPTPFRQQQVVVVGSKRWRCNSPHTHLLAYLACSPSGRERRQWQQWLTTHSPACLPHSWGIYPRLTP